MSRVDEPPGVIRYMIRRDLPAALEIESADQTSPWSMDDFLSRLRDGTCISMVFEARDTCSSTSAVWGHVVYGLRPDSLEILKLTVAPHRRRMGVGRALLTKLVSKLSLRRRSYLEIVVGDWNLSAQLFLRSQGFQAEKVLRRHFGLDDGYRMVYRMVAGATGPCEEDRTCRGV